jgi:putative aldouronate transport system substrate-binding protein
MAVMTACGSNPGTDSGSTTSAGETPAASESKGAPVEIVLGYPVLGEVPADIDAVEEEINKITLEKINAKVKLSRISIGQWFQQKNLILAGTEQMDLFVTSFEEYAGFVAKNQFLELDELLEKHGQDIQSVLGDKLEAARINGNVYALPVNSFTDTGTALLMRKDLLEKHGIDIASIKGTNDLDAVFQTMKEQENLYGVAPPNGPMPMTSVIDWLNVDTLADSLGVLPHDSADMKVVNLFEMPEYVEALKKMRSWYEAGYLPKDAANAKTAPQDLLKSGEVLSIYEGNTVFLEDQISATSGRELVKVVMQRPVLTTQNVLGLIWAMPRNNVKNPEKAMELLNLMYTDKDIINLINYGIEGKHYTKQSDNVISLLPDSGYRMNQSFMFGNRLLTYVLEGEDPALRDADLEFGKNVERSRALGFLPTTDAVTNEIVAVKSVLDQYRKALETGSVDPVKVHPEFVAKLKAAGIDTIIAEKQKQLDAWLAKQ